MANQNVGSAFAANYCLDFYRKGLIDTFINKDFVACYNFYRQSYVGTVSIGECIKKGLTSGPQILTLDQVLSNIKLPEGSQIILQSELEIPGNQGCAAPVNGTRDVKCWVCRGGTSRNDVLYRFKDKVNETPVRITPIEDTKLSTDGKEMTFTLVHDATDTDDLSSVLCKSSKLFQIANRNELISILGNNGIKLSIPAPKEK